VRVYIDESGDDGFKFGFGSSNHLCFAAMILPSELADQVGIGIPLIRHELGFRLDREFHYNSESEQTKKALV
jgi:hypothetical protein